jgi:hypothetical protein
MPSRRAACCAGTMTERSSAATQADVSAAVLTDSSNFSFSHVLH